MTGRHRLRWLLEVIAGMATVALAAWLSQADIATIAPAGKGLGLAVPLPGPSSVVAWIAMGAVSWRCWGWTRLPLVVLAFPLVASRMSAAWVYAGTGVAIVWAIWAAGVVGACWRFDWPRTTPVRAAVIAGATAAVWLGAAAFSLAPVSLTGDAPHYLTLAQSVLEDGDFDLKNNYDARTYEPFYRGSLEPRHTNQAPWGQEYSFHGPGVSMLVLPGLAAFGAPGATAILVLLLAFGSAFQWLTAQRLTGSAGAAWFAWAALVGSAPYTLHAAAIYPDGPAAVAVTVGVWLLVRLRDPSPTPLPVLVAGSVGLAALPWLHVRLAFPAGVIGSAILWVIVARQPDRWTRCLWFVTVPVISCAGWFAASVVLFDTWNPAAAIFQRTAPGSWSAAATGLLGMLADAEFGLFPTTPVMVAAPIAFVLFARQFPFLGGTTGLVAAGVWATSSFWVWWGGDAAPARFLTVVLPIFSLWLAHLWAVGRASTRRLLGLGLAISVALTMLLVGVDGGGRAYNFPDGRRSIFETLSTSVDVSRALPSLVAPSAVLRTELSIALVWLAAAVFALGANRRFPERLGREKAWGTAGLIVLTAGAAATWAGWRLRGVDAHTPATSQYALYTALSKPGMLLAAGDPLRPVGATALARTLELRTPEFVGPARDTLLHVPNLPAGMYAVRTDARPGNGGLLTLELGRDAWPFARWRLGDDSPPTFSLQTALHSVRITGAPQEAADVWLQPIGPATPRPPNGEARRVTRLGGVEVYSMDDSSFVEETGLWTGADRATRLVLAVVERARVTVTVEAGPARVRVDVAAESSRRQLQLASGQRAEVALGPLQPHLPVDLRLTVQGGFPARLLGDARDSRRLGVWVSFSVAPE